jgi:hypothetical protein
VSQALERMRNAGRQRKEEKSAYSISVTARASSPGGTTVFKLIASSNLVGRTTGISAGDASVRVHRPRPSGVDRMAWVRPSRA